MGESHQLINVATVGEPHSKGAVPFEGGGRLILSKESSEMQEDDTDSVVGAP